MKNHYRQKHYGEGDNVSGDKNTNHYYSNFNYARYSVFSVFILVLVFFSYIVINNHQFHSTILSIHPSSNSKNIKSINDKLIIIEKRLIETENKLRESERQVYELKIKLESISLTTNSDNAQNHIDLAKSLIQKYNFNTDFENNILSDSSLTTEEKATLLMMLIIQKMDNDILNQSRLVNRLQESFQAKNLDAPSLDVETLKLKRLVDKRSQMFDLLRQTIDKYNQSSSFIIDSIGR